MASDGGLELDALPGATSNVAQRAVQANTARISRIFMSTRNE
jgi:hypothetical protein